LSKVYAVDTNIILQDVINLQKISDNKTNTILIPEVVLMELEDKKKLMSDLGYQARQFARILAKMKTSEIDQKEGFSVVKKYDDNLVLHIISIKNYSAPIEQNYISESNDKRIIETIEHARSYYKGHKVIFLSLDIYARTFAQIKSIATQTLQEDKDVVPKIDFFKKIELDSSHFNTLDNKPILEVDPNHSCENFSYEISANDGNTRYGIVKNGHLSILDDKDFNNMVVKPINVRQKLLAKAIIDDMADVIIVDAKAGSGKTLVSFSSAMRLIDIGKYDSIVYVRNSIESVDKGAEVGFLSGNDEKFRIYNMAMRDTIEFIAKQSLKKTESKNKQEAIETKTMELQKKYNIQTLWPGEARGRTLSNSIVILDEWQNSSNNTTQLILSRLDATCKAIVIGSNRQIDNIYLNKYNNGLTYLLGQTKKYKGDTINLFAIELEKAVRGKFADFAERIYEKKS
jgi:PhoH-like ATPase